MYVGAPFEGPQGGEKGHVTTIASEPFDMQPDHWRAVEEGSFVHIADGAVTQTRVYL